MSFQQGLSGLNAASANLQVIGNNVANSATTGFKSSSAQFADLYADTLGGSKLQIGIGVTTANTDQSFGQGNITTTNNPLDLAINGNGFFQVSRSGALAYSRDGSFRVDASGYITNSQGDLLQGYGVNPATGAVQGGAPGKIAVSTGDIAPKITTQTDIGGNFNSGSTPLNPANFNPTDASTYTNTTTVQVYDSLGNAHNMSLYFIRSNAGGDKYDVRASLDGTMMNAGATVGTLAFNSAGAIDMVNSTFPSSLSLTLTNGATSPQPVNLSFAGSTAFGSAFGVTTVNQDGFAAGSLSGYRVTADGILDATYTNGQTRPLAQVVLASFSNPQGLQAMSGNAWEQTAASGQALIGAPNSGTNGSITSGALEQSNVNLTDQLVNMITAQRDYQANAQSIKTEDQLLQTLVTLR